MDYLISARPPNLVIVNKKKTCELWTLLSQQDHKVKSKESEKKDKYLDVARKLKKTNKLWNMKETVKPIVIGVLSTVTKGLIQELEDLEIRGPIDATQTTALLRSARILGSVQETWGDLLSLKLHWEAFS